MELTMNERSMTAIYAAPTLAETVERMAAAPVEEMEEEIRMEFLSALRKLKAMSEQEYQKLDLQDVLVTDDEELREVEENAGA